MVQSGTVNIDKLGGGNAPSGTNNTTTPATAGGGSCSGMSGSCVKTNGNPGNTGNPGSPGNKGSNGGSVKIYGGTVNITTLKGGNGGKGGNGSNGGNGGNGSKGCTGTKSLCCQATNGGNGGIGGSGGNGGAGGTAPSLYVYGGMVSVTNILVGTGGDIGIGGANGTGGAGGPKSGDRCLSIEGTPGGSPGGKGGNGTAGALGGKGNLVIAGGSVTISNAGGANAAINKTTGGTAVFRNTITFNPANAPVGATAVGDRPVLCGKTGSIQCDSASKWHNDPNTRAAREINGVYGLKDVKTDGNGRFYPWLPNASNEAVELSLYSNCSPMRGVRNGSSATLKWESIKITYKCQGVGCNTAFADQIITQPPTCN